MDIQRIRTETPGCRACIHLNNAGSSLMPVDVHDLQCDFMSVTSRKFLRGPRGAGFLYVSKRVLNQGLEPLFIDMKGTDWVAEHQYRPIRDAKRFENWEFAWALVLGTGEAARYASNIGLKAIQDRVRMLAGRLRTALSETDRVHVLDQGKELCGIVSIGIAGQDPAKLMAALRKRRIHTTAQIRIYALMDFDRKGVGSSLSG